MARRRKKPAAKPEGTKNESKAETHSPAHEPNSPAESVKDAASQRVDGSGESSAKPSADPPQETETKENPTTETDAGDVVPIATEGAVAPESKAPAESPSGDSPPQADDGADDNIEEEEEIEEEDEDESFDEVGFELPLGDLPVGYEAQMAARGRLILGARHQQVDVSAEHAEFVLRLREGLKESGVMVEGQEVESNLDVFRWFLSLLIGEKSTY